MAKEKGKENYKLAFYTNRTLKSVVNQMLLIDNLLGTISTGNIIKESRV